MNPQQISQQTTAVWALLFFLIAHFLNLPKKILRKLFGCVDLPSTGGGLLEQYMRQWLVWKPIP